ncbi:hypothetical protein ACX1DX_12000 [Tessaracoccus sp. Y36]
MTEFSISTIDAQEAAAVRRNVPTTELTTAFDTGFSQVTRAVTEQGATVTRSPHPGQSGDHDQHVLCGGGSGDPGHPEIDDRVCL